MTQPRIAIPIPTFADHDYNQRSWSAYADAVRHSGGIPVEVPLTITPGDLTHLIHSCQGVLLPGSPADVDPIRYGQNPIPECAAVDEAREEIDLRLLEESYQRRMPLFCICFGTQMLNVWRGGSLIQDLTVVPVNHKAGRSVLVAHTVSVLPTSRLATMLHPDEAPFQEGFLRLPVNSSHHQAVAIPGENLHVTARCPQDAVIEALEGDDPDHYVVAVQWHPERTYTESATSRFLFHRFLQQAATQPAG